MKPLLLTLISFLAVTTGLLAQPLSQKLDEYLTSAHQMDQFTGVALVAQKGNTLLHKAYGLSNAARQTPNDTITRFPILSITKTFTSTVILLLQEQGKLSVHNKLTTYFPDFPKGDSITIDHLLTHTSGLFDYMSLIDEEDSAIVCHPVGKQQVVDFFKNRPLAFKPGATFAYCNSGYFLLGLVIEKVTGKPYEHAVQEMIFKPLGMAHSGFDYLNLPASARAQGYDTLTTTYQSPYPHFDSTVAYAAGAMYSTAGDLYRWGRAVATRQLLSADSWKQAFIPRLNNYGYGWMTGRHLKRHYVGHDGGYPGFMSSFVYYPDDDITIILLKNSGHYGESLTPTGMALTAILLKKPYSNWQQRTEINLPETALQPYVGRYRVDPKIVPDRILTVSLENGKLFVQATDEPRIELFAQSEDSFFLKAFNEQWLFQRDRKGQVTKAVVHGNGIDVTVRKLPLTPQTAP
ncbi:serine hydrolase [Spirosoma fluviale]|uniref:CubicO group peptidase, beta-lactamase class C family n=1 Tax=Spirosoma fluviale TaxID=1597977 RepID=A0A286GJE7_9BACT|nr:serine hydrolase [Spirosoma fluviale]SOD95346.1 CubicO group peptidase, beta-lactamase class C family [Spirosoma fluviale]